jgi:thioester reductase-like protein
MILITGATGFLGGELLARSLRLNPSEDFCAVVRPSLLETSSQRLRAALRNYLSDNELDEAFKRIRVFSGDLLQERFGLSHYEFDELVSCTDTVIHCAAEVSLSMSIEKARRTNLSATQNVISFCDQIAKRHPLRDLELNFVSTAFVAGKNYGVSSPDELVVTPSHFRNGYEQSKAESELEVRRAGDRYRVLIYRPSVIVGDSVTGYTSSFNVLYIPARLFIRGLFRALPAIPNANFDVVPVDHVAASLLALRAMRPPSGSCFYLTAGLGRETSPKEIMQLIVEVFTKYRKLGLNFFRPPFMAPEILALAQDSFAAALHSLKHFEKIVCEKFNVLQQTLPFIPYMIKNPRFDSSATVKLLGEAPLFATYGEQLFKYCLDSNWGKKEVRIEQRVPGLA